MARPDKVAAVADVRDHLSSSAATLLTNYRGLSVAAMAELRGELAKSNARYRVVKNTLTKIAAHDAGFEGLDDMLIGPTALVFCEDDPVGPAKAIKAFARDHPDLEFKGAYMEGGVLDAAEALGLADLASREELLGQLVGLMHGALANTARLLNALPEKQVRLLQALVDAGGPSGGGSEPAATADEPAPADESTTEPAPADAPVAEAAESVAAPAEESVAAPAEEPVAESVEEDPADAGTPDPAAVDETAPAEPAPQAPDDAPDDDKTA